jgi:putative Mn2+ efflux pump MntP
MEWTTLQWGQILSLLIMAFALGLDAFSLGLGVGMRGVTVREIWKISSMIGLFHVIMPLIGLIVGRSLNQMMGDVATFIGGALLLVLGIHMVYSSFNSNNEATMDYTTGWGLLLFSLTVSMDALSVGFSLGLFQTEIWFTIVTFGCLGWLMSCLGLALGRYIGNWLGDYGEALGGFILVAFGIKILV